MQKLRLYGFSSLFLFVIFLRLIDSYKNPNFVVSMLTVSSGTLLFILFLLIVLARIFGKILLNKKVAIASVCVGVFLTIFMGILAIINFSTYENFIFGLTSIHIDQLYMLGMFMMFSGVLSLPSKILKHKYKLLIFSLGVLLFILYYMYGYFPLDARHQIAKEDNLVENLQFIFLVLSSFFSLLIAKKLFSKKKIFAIIFVFASFGFLFVAADEISWGQRIFGIQTPEYIAKNNVQNEISIHNHTSVHGETSLAFAVVGAYGAFAWLCIKPFGKFLKKHSTLLLFIPGWFLFPFFFAGFFYNFYTRLGDHHIGNFAEPTELMLYLGVFLYMFVLSKTLVVKKNAISF